MSSQSNFQKQCKEIVYEINLINKQSSEKLGSATTTQVCLYNNQISIETKYESGQYSFNRTAPLSDAEIMNKLSELLEHSKEIQARVEKFIKINKTLDQCEKAVNNLSKKDFKNYDA